MALVLQCDDAATDPSIPLLYRDAWINSGTLALFDVADPYSFPLQAAPPTGTILKNLVDGGADAVVNGAGLTFDSNGIGFPGGSSTFIGLGTGYDLSTSGGFLILAWYYQDAVPVTANSPLLFGRRSNSNLAQAAIDFNGVTKIPRGSAGAGASPPVYVNAPSANPDNSMTQIGVSWEGNGKNVFLWRNGAVAANFGPLTGPLSTIPTEWQVGGTRGTTTTNSFRGSVKRWAIENLTISGAKAADRVALDYALNKSGSA